MYRYKRKDFDIFQIMNSGQCFRMEAIGPNIVACIAGDSYLEVTQEEEYCVFSCDGAEFDAIWKDYFDLDTDYGSFKDKIDTSDAYLTEAARYGGGIRILRQDVCETIITFIISQQNNIPRIRRLVDVLSRTYGEARHNHKDEAYYGFPKIERLAMVTEDELKDLRFGYRGKYIAETARAIHKGKFRMDGLAEMTYEEAKGALMTLSGVGKKVADCVCLFALHHIDAFPIDTHIGDILERHYKDGFPFEKYEGFAGVLQQYAFFHELYGK